MEYAHKKYLQETGKSPYSGEEYDGDKLYTTEYMEWLEKTAMEGFSLPIHNVVSSLPSECQENWESNYYCSLSGKCQKCEK